MARRARDAGYEATGVTAYRNASIMAIRLMDYDGARNSLREGLRYADEIEQSYCRRLMAATSAMIAWTTGDWDVAVSPAEMELVERGSVRGSLGSRDALGFVAFGRGDVDRARTLLGDSLAVGREAARSRWCSPRCGASRRPRSSRASRPSPSTIARRPSGRRRGA